jgi:hypothetical protein
VHYIYKVITISKFTTHTSILQEKLGTWLHTHVNGVILSVIMLSGFR